MQKSFDYRVKDYKEDRIKIAVDFLDFRNIVKAFCYEPIHYKHNENYYTVYLTDLEYTILCEVGII